MKFKCLWESYKKDEASWVGIDDLACNRLLFQYVVRETTSTLISCEARKSDDPIAVIQKWKQLTKGTITDNVFDKNVRAAVLLAEKLYNEASKSTEQEYETQRTSCKNELLKDGKNSCLPESTNVVNSAISSYLPYKSFKKKMRRVKKGMLKRQQQFGEDHELEDLV